MSQFPSLPLFTDAFLADTGHLSAQETGAYLLLLMMAWRLPDCRLPDDDQKLSRWARVDNRTWQRIKPAIMEFWSFEDGFWIQKRLSKERVVVSKRAEVARDNGKHGGRPKSLENNDADNPAGSLRDTQRKAPNPNPNPIQDKNTPSLRSGERAPARKAANRLPEDWAPSSDDREYGRKLGLSDAEIDGAAEDMRLWAKGKGEAKADWGAAFKGWMRRDMKRPSMNGSARPPPQTRYQPQIKDPFVAQLAQVYERQQEPGHDPSDDDLFGAQDAGSFESRSFNDHSQIQEPSRGASRPVPALLNLRVACPDRH